ncbi:hypothetical protein M758_8G124200 [Ceratodon purpureus]|nr:hypothetical protein M758_8G124200 [Ceratodon purpureus]
MKCRKAGRIRTLSKKITPRPGLLLLRRPGTFATRPTVALTPGPPRDEHGTCTSNTAVGNLLSYQPPSIATVQCPQPLQVLQQIAQWTTMVMDLGPDSMMCIF